MEESTKENFPFYDMLGNRFIVPSNILEIAYLNAKKKGDEPSRYIYQTVVEIAKMRGIEPDIQGIYERSKDWVMIREMRFPVNVNC